MYVDSASCCSSSQFSHAALQQQNAGLQGHAPHVPHVSDFRFKFLHAPLINAVEELDRVEQSHGHLALTLPSLSFILFTLVLLIIVKLFNLGMKAQSLDVDQQTTPMIPAAMFLPENILMDQVFENIC